MDEGEEGARRRTLSGIRGEVGEGEQATRTRRKMRKLRGECFVCGMVSLRRGF